MRLDGLLARFSAWLRIRRERRMFERQCRLARQLASEGKAGICIHTVER